MVRSILTPAKKVFKIFSFLLFIIAVPSWADARVVFVIGQVTGGPAGKTPVTNGSIIKDGDTLVTGAESRVIVYDPKKKQTLNVPQNQSGKLTELFTKIQSKRLKLFTNMRNSTYRKITTTAAVRGAEQGKKAVSWADDTSPPKDYSQAWSKFKAGDFNYVYNFTKSSADPEGRLLRALSRVSAGNQEFLNKSQLLQAEQDLQFASDKTSDYTLRLAARQALGMYYMDQGEFQKAETAFWKLWSSAKPSDIPELVYIQMVKAAQIGGQPSRVSTYLRNLRRFYPATSYR